LLTLPPEIWKIDFENNTKSAINNLAIMPNLCDQLSHSDNRFVATNRKMIFFAPAGLPLTILNYLNACIMGCPYGANKDRTVFDLQSCYPYGILIC
jgi:hypothetical protein